MKIESIIIVLFSMLILSTSSCISQSKNYKTIAPAEFKTQVLKTKKAQLLDVRTPEEYTAGHLSKSKNINWNGSDFEIQVQKLDKNEPVFVYCKAGGRSANASQKLSELGFKNIINMDGGITKWNEAGLETEK